MNQDEEFKQQIQANDYGESMAEFDQYKKWKDEHDPNKAPAKAFCPNCEKETECTHVAELYECDECGEDFAKYIVGRTELSNSDVSMTENVSIDIKTPQSVESVPGEAHEFHFTEALRNLSKSRPADVSAIGVSILIDHVEELEALAKEQSQFMCWGCAKYSGDCTGCSAAEIHNKFRDVIAKGEN